MDTLRFADAIIDHTNHIQTPINNLKLEKIVYYLNVIYMLQNKGQSLVTEPFHAWIYGPINLDVYHEYAKYGRDPIIKTDPHLVDINDDGLVFDHYADHPVNNHIQKFIEINYPKLGLFNGFELVAESQKEPQWQALRQNYRSDGPMSHYRSYQFYQKHQNQFWN